MANNSLASLVVDLQLEVAGLKKSVDEAKKQLASLEDPIHKIHEGLDKMFEFENFKVLFEATKMLGEFVMKGAEAADLMGKMAQSAGVTTEEFSRLAYAAGLSHVSAEDLGTAMKKLNVGLSEAATGSTKQAALFQALGISVKDSSGHVRNAGEVMRDVAERFSGLQDGASKSALAVELFGKAGAQMIPMLNEGKEGLAELGEESDKLGNTINDKTAKAAQSFNDNLERVKKAVDGVALQVVANLAPSLAQLTEGFTRSDTAAKGFKGTADLLTTFIKVLASAAVEAAGFLRTAGTQFALLASDVIDFSSMNFESILLNSRVAQAELDEISKETSAQMDAIWDPKAVQDFNENLQPVKKSADDIAKAFKDGEKALEAQKKKAKELSDALEHMADVEFKRIDAEAKAKFDLKLKFAGIDTDASGMRDQYKRAGMTADPMAALRDAVAGFSDFDQAMERSVFFAKARESELSRAASLESDSRFAEAQSARESAAELDSMSKDAAGAAGAFIKIKDVMVRGVGTVDGALSALGSAVLQAVPRLNQLVSAAAQGAQAGGLWGALIAVFIQLISQTKAFQTILDVVNEDLDSVIGVLEPFVSGLAGLIKAFSPFTGAFLAPLKGVFQVIGDLLTSLVPLLTSIMEPLKAVSGIVSMFGDLMDRFAKPVFELLKVIGVLLKVLAPILQLLMLPLELIGRLFGGLLDLLNPVFKEIDKGISWLANRLDEFGYWVSHLGEMIENFVKGHGFHANSDFVDNDPSKGLKPTHNSNESDRAEHNDDSQALIDPTANAAGAIDDLGSSAAKTAKAIDKLSASFSNVPDGFKNQLRTYEATTDDGGGMSAGRVGPGLFQVIVQGSVISQLELAKYIEAALARSAFKRTGKGGA